MKFLGSRQTPLRMNSKDLTENLLWSSIQTRITLQVLQRHLKVMSMNFHSSVNTQFWSISSSLSRSNITYFQQLLGMRMPFWVMPTKEDSMINVEKRGGILQHTAQITPTLSQTFRLKTSLICSLEEVTRQVSGTVFMSSLHEYFHCNAHDLSTNTRFIHLGNANVYTNGRMRYPRRERRERQRDVSYY